MRNQIMGRVPFERHSTSIEKTGIGDGHLKATLDFDQLDEIVAAFDNDRQWIEDYLRMMNRRIEREEKIRHIFI